MKYMIFIILFSTYAFDLLAQSKCTILYEDVKPEVEYCLGNSLFKDSINSIVINHKVVFKHSTDMLFVWNSTLGTYGEYCYYYCFPEYTYSNGPYVESKKQGILILFNTRKIKINKYIKFIHISELCDDISIEIKKILAK